MKTPEGELIPGSGTSHIPLMYRIKNSTKEMLVLTVSRHKIKTSRSEY